MDIKGKTKLFINIIKNAENGELSRAYSTSCARKNEDGSYDHLTVGVFFKKEAFPAEKLAKLDSNSCYDLDIEEGFLTIEKWKDGSLHPAVMVTAGKLTGKKPIALKKEPVKTAKSEALPF